jgi:hypothetical protein
MKHVHVAAALLLSVTTTAIANPTTRPITASAGDRVEQLIEQLGADDFKARAAAASQLRNIGRSALPALKDRRHADPEIESWCAALVEQLDPQLRPDVAQLIASEITGIKVINGRVLRVQIERPVIDVRVRADIERLVEAKQLRVQRLVEVEAEIHELRRQLARPAELGPQLVPLLRIKRAEPAAPAAQ